MVDRERRPTTTRDMTKLAFVGAIDVRGALAFTINVVMAAFTHRCVNQGMVERCARPSNSGMANATFAGGGNMRGRFSWRKCAVVTRRAKPDYFVMVDGFRRRKLHCGMTAVAVVRRGDMACRFLMAHAT